MIVTVMMMNDLRHEPITKRQANKPSKPCGHPGEICVNAVSNCASRRVREVLRCNKCVPAPACFTTEEKHSHEERRARFSVTLEATHVQNPRTLDLPSFFSPSNAHRTCVHTDRCPALVEIDIDARRLSEEGAAIIADALPRLTGISLRNGYGWSGIGSLTMAVARAAGLMCPRPPSTTPPSPSSKSKGGRDGWAEERTTQEEVHRRIGMRRGSTSPAENTAITPREQKPQHQQSQSLANPSSVTTVAKHKPAVLPPAPSAGAGTEGLLCWRGKRSAAGAKVTKTKVSAAQRERWPLGAARSSKVGPDSVLPSTAPPHGSWCYRQGRCLLALRSLVLCGLGPAAGLGNPSAEHFEEWACLAEASAPVLRSLTITNASAGQLPLCALTPFFGYPRIRSTASGTQANSPPPVLRRAERGRGKDEPPGAGVGTGEVRSVRAAEDTHDGLVELTLATVSSELAATVLRGVKRPVPLCFRREGGAAFPGGPRPPLLVLKRLNLVVDGVTDALCSAIAEGCPNVQEVSVGTSVWLSMEHLYPGG